ncbi:MAG: hypothetical protein SFY69_03795 [Planctomycetota bacterium]|nr:hypothetical protein [Planctomycetota bacterium]
MSTRRTLASLTTLASLAAAALVGGCRSGSETYVFPSTPHTPQTVTLVNTRTGERLWSQEIPAGSQLNMTFVRSYQSAEGDGYDELRWSLTPLGRPVGNAFTNSASSRTSSMRVPPPSERRLDVDVRPGPEDRPARTAWTTPAAESVSTTPPPPNTAPAAPTAPASPPAPSRTPEGIVLPDPKQPAPK